MVIESLIVASLATGATSTFIGIKEFLAPRRRALAFHNASAPRLEKSIAQGRPCPKCDLSTLRYLNSKNHGDNCVTVTFDMPACCERCASLKERILLKHAPETLCVAALPIEKVCVQVPMTTYGCVQRSVESAVIGEKGSSYRATGTFVKHLCGLRVPEAEKIAMLRWFPHILGLAFQNHAKVELPRAPGDYLGHLTIEEICDHNRLPKREKNAEAHKRIFRRLRKLKKDERLTDQARRLLRYNKDERARKIQDLVNQQGTDDIFSLNLVELMPLSKGKEIEIEDQLCGLSECSEDSTEHPEVQELSEPRGAEVPPDAVEESMTNVEKDSMERPNIELSRGSNDGEQFAIATEPAASPKEALITRDEFLALRISGGTGLGFLVGKPKRLRRDRLVAARG